VGTFCWVEIHGMFSLLMGNIAVTLSIVIVIIRFFQILLDVVQLWLCRYCSDDFCGRLLYCKSLEETNNC
jgi:hypothetical protein